MPDNPIADPLVENVDSDSATPLVHLDATPEGVAYVTLNRPARRNSFNAELIGGLREAFETLQGAEGVRIVFLRGAGGTFSAGADLEWMRDAIEASEADNRADALQMAIMLKTLYDIPALTVALVEGGAYGGGAGLAAACDMAIALKDASFVFSEVKLGLIAATISPYVVQAIGPRKARSLFATGRVFGAEEAMRIGLVDQVVDDLDALHAAADKLCETIMACAPDAVGESKRLVEHVAGERIDRGLLEETAKRIAKARVSPEGQEGVRAFLEKRKASWAEGEVPRASWR
jgi:methylglutaconyl-CoA hydratase